jgi:hypothetical protein
MAGQREQQRPIDEVRWSGPATGDAAEIVSASLARPTFRSAWGKGWLYRAYVTWQERLYCVVTYYVGDEMRAGRITALKGE